MSGKNMDPERCTLHCRNMKRWLADTEGVTETEYGPMENKEIVRDALELCPGVQVTLVRGLDPALLHIEQDVASLPVSELDIYCSYFEAVHHGM